MVAEFLEGDHAFTVQYSTQENTSIEEKPTQAPGAFIFWDISPKKQMHNCDIKQWNHKRQQPPTEYGTRW